MLPECRLEEFKTFPNVLSVRVEASLVDTEAAVTSIGLPVKGGGLALGW